MNQKIIDTVLKNSLCAGCGLCSSITNNKIKMVLSEKGYLRPQVQKELSSLEKEIINFVCPGLTVNNSIPQTNPSILWGNIKSSYTGYSIDKKIRYAGSSGGILSAILIYLIEAKKVDYVVHIGVSKKDPLQNIIKISKSRTEIIENSGSRYAPSAPLQNISELIAKKGKFAIVGKPCDISALRQYAKKNPKVDNKITYMFSFFCAGIPSMKGTEAVLKKLGVKINELDSFRYRGNGWPGMTSAKMKNGEVREMTYNDSWREILSKYLQLRCKICVDGIGELADIVGGDAWYGDKNGYPDFTEREGRSLILTRTDNGQKLLQECIDKNILKVEPFKLEVLDKIQPYQSMRKKTLFARLLALKLCFRKIPRYQNFKLVKASIKGGLKNNLKYFIGMCMRVVNGKVSS